MKSNLELARDNLREMFRRWHKEGPHATYDAPAVEQAILAMDEAVKDLSYSSYELNQLTTENKALTEEVKRLRDGNNFLSKELGRAQADADRERCERVQLEESDNCQLVDAEVEIANQKKLIEWHTTEDVFLRAQVERLKGSKTRIREAELSAEVERLRAEAVTCHRANDDLVARHLDTNAKLATANALLDAIRAECDQYERDMPVSAIRTHLAGQPAIKSERK